MILGDVDFSLSLRWGSICKFIYLVGVLGGLVWDKLGYGIVFEDFLV